jgi:hypothetical protein
MKSKPIGLIDGMKNTAKSSAIPFAFGCGISMLSFLDNTSAFFTYRWIIATVLLSAGLLSFLYSTARSIINEFFESKAALEEIIGDTRQMLRMEDIERKYLLQGQDTYAEICMLITNISDQPINTIDVRLRADNGNGTNQNRPEIMIRTYRVNGKHIQSPETLIVDYRMVSWPTYQRRRQCEVTARLPLSLEGSIKPGQKSEIVLSVLLKNNLALFGSDIDNSSDDSITFEIPIPTRRFVTLVEAEPTHQSCWTKCAILASAECPLGVGAYSGYGSVVDHKETARLSAPMMLPKGFRWEVDKPLLGYTYCIRYKLVR